MHFGRVVVAVFALSILSAAAIAAVIPEPVLRPSETLDIRRLGRVTDDERAVLRVEWRSARTSAEEAQSVEEMLSRLRRMEGTVGEIGRLVRDMPAAKSMAVTGASEPSESDDHTALWALAGSALAVLLAFWWTRRRDSPKPTAAGLDASPAARPDIAGLPDPALPDLVPLDLAEPAEAPVPDIAVQDPVAVPATPAPEQSAIPGVDEIKSEDFTATVIIKLEPPPPLVPIAKPEPASEPVAETAEPAAPPPRNDIPLIEFSLEDEDPETIARVNARVPVPRKNSAASRVPERRRETDVEATLQLAEIMLSMGLEQSAAQALLEYIDANPKHALYHWLKLLGIYRKRGLRDEFIETAEKLRQHFNIQAEAWTRVDTGEAPTLENFSRVSEHVQQIWLQPEECRGYLQRLLEDNRDGARAGFPQSVAEEILLLVEILKEVSGANQVVDT